MEGERRDGGMGGQEGEEQAVGSKQEAGKRVAHSAWRRAKRTAGFAKAAPGQGGQRDRGFSVQVSGTGVFPSGSQYHEGHEEHEG